MSRLCIQRKIEKLYLSDLTCFDATPHKCYLRINNELFKLVYNDEMNLLTILSSCNSVKGMSLMKDPKALSLRNNHMDLFF